MRWSINLKFKYEKFLSLFLTLYTFHKIQILIINKLPYGIFDNRSWAWPKGGCDVSNLKFWNSFGSMASQLVALPLLVFPSLLLVLLFPFLWLSLRCIRKIYDNTYVRAHIYSLQAQVASTNFSYTRAWFWHFLFFFIFFSFGTACCKWHKPWGSATHRAAHIYRCLKYCGRVVFLLLWKITPNNTMTEPLHCCTFYLWHGKDICAEAMCVSTESSIFDPVKLVTWAKAPAFKSLCVVIYDTSNHSLSWWLSIYENTSFMFNVLHFLQEIHIVSKVDIPRNFFTLSLVSFHNTSDTISIK